MSDETRINYEKMGLTKGEALAALYNRAKTQGMGILHYTPEDMTVQQAEEMIVEYGGQKLYFDYLKGRVMKVDLSGDSFDPWLYDRDNGDGAALEALEGAK